MFLFDNIEAFRAAILALPLEVKLDPTPAVVWRTLRGRRIEFTYGQTPRIDGRPLDYGAWRLYEGPYLNAEDDSRRMVLTHGGELRD